MGTKTKIVYCLRSLNYTVASLLLVCSLAWVPQIYPPAPKQQHQLLNMPLLVPETQLVCPLQTLARTDLHDAVSSDNASLLSRGFCHGRIHQPARTFMAAYVYPSASKLGQKVLSLSRLRPPDGSSVLHRKLSSSGCSTDSHVLLEKCGMKGQSRTVGQFVGDHSGVMGVYTSVTCVTARCENWRDGWVNNSP